MPARACRLVDTARLASDKVLNPEVLASWRSRAPIMGSDVPVLVVLAAGKGTRFGTEPKCIQPVRGRPLARHSIDALRRFQPAPVVCLVGYQHQIVSRALGTDNLYIRSEHPAGGTAFAAFEAFSIPALRDANPLLVITMGDRIVPTSVFRRLIETHAAPPQEADLTFLTALYAPPHHRGKGRVVRDETGHVQRIVEQGDIDAVSEPAERRRLDGLLEGNCPLYAVRADTLYRALAPLTNANAQQQYYLTDMIEAISRKGGVIRTITTSTADPEHDVLCADVTRPADLQRLEVALAKADGLDHRLGRHRGDRPLPPARPTSRPASDAPRNALRTVTADRPPGEIAAIARQLEALLDLVAREQLGFVAGRPVAIGIAGGRLRIAFMHPDMARFYGPAWQMPMGAGDAGGSEQIVMLVQAADDGRIRLHPLEPKYQERLSAIPADFDAMYPGEDVVDPGAYEAFGTRMSEALLRLQGYMADDEARQPDACGKPRSEPSQWLSANLRRPWPLVANALASLRTVRAGKVGAKIQASLGRAGFRGLRIVTTGNIPEGGFSSSSAVTVATLNALDALYGFGLAPEVLVRVACQAEYGTGVRAGSLDQATEQTGKAGLGTLISSNPRDNYRPFHVFRVPTECIQILFPCSVARDREAWRWSWGAYAQTPAPGHLTAGEMRKMTGKSAEIAALLTRLPLDQDFFQLIEDELLQAGALSPTGARRVASILRQLPLRIRQAELRSQLETHRDWLVEEWRRRERLDITAARNRFQTYITGLLAGWHDPVLRRATPSGAIVSEEGLPLRATVAYLFGETAKNFRLIHHPDEWIACVTASQRGDRCVDLDPQVLPRRDTMETPLPWEAGVAGPARLDLWLDRFSATPFDFNRGLDDDTLSAPAPPQFHRLEGSNFFRGLALIDLAEAMLKRAFGSDAVAVRVNAAGQGDFFQVHVDRHKADVHEVKEFIRRAFYRRFGLAPDPEFVEAHPGGGAVGLRLDRYDSLPALVGRLRRQSAKPQLPSSPG